MRRMTVPHEAGTRGTLRAIARVGLRPDAARLDRRGRGRRRSSPSPRVSSGASVGVAALLVAALGLGTAARRPALRRPGRAHRRAARAARGGGHRGGRHARRRRSPDPADRSSSDVIVIGLAGSLFGLARQAYLTEAVPVRDARPCPVDARRRAPDRLVHRAVHRSARRRAMGDRVPPTSSAGVASLGAFVLVLARARHHGPATGSPTAQRAAAVGGARCCCSTGTSC